MENLSKQPFLLSMKQATEQTEDFKGYETLLQAQQDAFKEYLYESCHSAIPAQQRYEFLQTAEYEVCHIRLMCADKIRKNNIQFYHFWAMMIVDTRRYINVGIKSLEFQRKCPPHMLVEPSHTFPDYKWISNRIDLSECLVGLYLTDVIRLKDGRRPPFALFAKFVGNFFGIAYPEPHDDMRKVLNRKKNSTPFLYRIIESIKSKSAKMDELKM